MATKKKATKKKATKRSTPKTGIPSKKRATPSASKKGSKKKSTKAEVEVDPEHVKPAKVTEENLEALAELKKKAADGDAEAIQALIEVTTNFSQWRLAKDRQKAVAKECKDRLEQEEAAVGEAIEKPIPIGSTQETFDATRSKLEVIEHRWQDLEEVKAANKEQKKAAQKAVRDWAGKLDRAIQDSAQLTLGRGKVAGFQ